jgi:hypothetical protein
MPGEIVTPVSRRSWYVRELSSVGREVVGGRVVVRRLSRIRRKR